MSDLTRAEIAEMTGLPPSSLTRHLRQFPEARTEHGRYSMADEGFAAWLAEHAADGAPVDLPRPRRAPRAAPCCVLPSGIMIGWAGWDALRAPDEASALRALEQFIRTWRLCPHSAVPDALPFEPMVLAKGIEINARQWRLFRSSGERRAMRALDVLVRSWPPEWAR